MESKQNDSTYNRPDGARVLDGPLVRMNIPDYVRQINTEAAWLNGDRNAITLLHNDRLRLVLIALHQNAEMAAHSVDGPCAIQVLQGRVWLQTEAQSISMEDGDALALAPKLVHSVFAEEECVFLLTLAGNSQGEF
jgi:quercetin dioxygenase-like cupin family protein